ncbi:hypothetical protein ACIRRA_39385 [Nocardia sp. NPDC101769]|uniref:hypothetical protein n=1 Tax=Nocardia sp. NPDC101769 TaxID=3364333 RepID=UPI003819EAB3
MIPLADDRHVEIAMRLTQTRRRMLNDLIGLRKHQRILQSEIAEATGLTAAEVAAFEDDPELADPTFDFLLRYAHAIGAVVEMKVVPRWAADA